MAEWKIPWTLKWEPLVPGQISLAVAIVPWGMFTGIIIIDRINPVSGTSIFKIWGRGLIFGSLRWQPISDKPCRVPWKELKASNVLFAYTGWPRKNATLTINNFKKTRDRMKKLCALLRTKFFSQQDDTKIINFDEGVLIMWLFFWGNVIFKICPSISKVTIYIPKNFPLCGFSG